ncbi:hypothetical protein KOR34_19890 [Posidoniimonas corsicana]|uniref:DUF469 domain-containing protein n=1 Tax=Posidoniimonas corsicana TaxID=1938618 RepID=A0A5C5VH99_9BACT|nr:50S ribosome-binding protein YggL [Posidoniimonas corsicana]TWT37042.1 hypothetical protein KOR34_19890 [Posidoniimonas corsicana]
MKKRLRKKLRLGEFREYGFEIAFATDPRVSAATRNSVLDEFIEMIESRNLQFGGGGLREYSGFVAGPWRGSATDEDRQAVLQWLHAQAEIVAAKAGPMRDAWHG